MNELAWLVEHRFESVTQREYDWLFAFDKNITLTVDCLWRLIEDGRIRLTSQDEGQQFGLPAPVNAAEEINCRLAQTLITAVELREEDDLWKPQNGQQEAEQKPCESAIASREGDKVVLQRKWDRSAIFPRCYEMLQGPPPRVLLPWPDAGCAATSLLPP
jgi:hypothetical protein